MTRDSDSPPDGRSARELILARRKFFIASALASAAIGAACDKPRPCLDNSVPQPSVEPQSSEPRACLDVAEPEPPPRVCLDMERLEPSAQPSASTSASASTPAPPPPPPRVCLRMKPPPG